MSSEEEIQRMIVRFMGDDSDYQAMLRRSKQETEEWQKQILRIREQGIIKQQLMERELVAGNSSRASFAGAAVGGPAMLAAAAGVAALKAGVEIVKSSWMDTVAEIKRGADATVFFSDETEAAMKRTQREVDNFSDSLKRVKGDIATLAAPALEATAGWFAEMTESARYISTYLKGGGREVGRQRLEDIMAEKRKRESRITEDLTGKAMKREQDAIRQLNIQLGRVTEEQAAIQELTEKLAERNVKITQETENQVKSVIRQRQEREKELKVMQEREQAARSAAQEELRAIEQRNRIIARHNEEIAADAQRRQMSGMDTIMKRAEINFQRGQLEAQMNEIMNSGVPISAGAAIEAGTPQARTMTKFGTAQERMSDLLKQMHSLEKEERDLLQRAARGIERMNDNPTITATIA